MKRTDKFFLLILFFIYAIIRIAVFAKPLLQIDGYAIPDDAYLSLDIARNFADGKWFYYGTQHTSGFQPLYAIIMAPVFLLFKSDAISPIYISLTILSLFGFGTIYLLFKLVGIIYEDEYSPFISVLFYILLPVSIINQTNGLETSISFFLCVVIFYFLYKFRQINIKEISSKQIFIFAVVTGFAIIARIDNVLLIPGIFLYAFLKYRNDKLRLKDIIPEVLIFSAGVAVIYLPYAITSFAFTGDIFPISGKAVHQIGKDMADYYSAGQTSVFTLLKLSLKNIFTNYSVVIGFVIVSVFIVSLKTRTYRWFKNSVAEHLPLITTSLLLFAVYSFYLNATWFYSRYFFPLSLLFIISAGFSFNQLSISFNSAKSKAVIFLGVIIVLITITIIRPGFKDFFFKDYMKSGYIEIGEWVNNNFPEGTTIGSNQTGSMGYFARNMNIINLDGVVNKEAYNAIKNKELIEYVKNKKIEYFIDWKINYEFLVRNSKNFKDKDIDLIQRVDGIKSWDYEWFVYKVNY